MEMMDRSAAVADRETIGGCNCRADPMFGVADRGLHLLAFR